MTLYKAVFSGSRREYTGPEDTGCVRAAASTKEDVGQRVTEVARLPTYASALLVFAYGRLAVFTLA